MCICSVWFVFIMSTIIRRVRASLILPNAIDIPVLPPSYTSWSPSTHLLIIALIASGSCDILMIKLLDQTVAEGSDGVRHAFEHAGFQVCAMPFRNGMAHT